MVTYMTKLAETSRRLNMDGRNLLSVAFKNVVGARRASWRVLHSLEEKEEKKESGRAKDVALYKAQVEDELEKICQQVGGHGGMGGHTRWSGKCSEFARPSS